jgi:Raf kinase inhibitor-like YbhB/YbcL family protein
MYKCMHENVSPPLSWTPGPGKTLSYAMTLAHSTTWHWVLWDIPATVTSLPMGVERLADPPVPAGSKQVKTNKVDGATWFGYTGPCPHAGASTYPFTVYALDVANLSEVTTQSTPEAVLKAIQGHTLAKATMTVAASGN